MIREPHQVTQPLVSKTKLRESSLGTFEILQMLARGGTASVYLAEHTITHKRVALKMLDPMLARSTEIAERFVQEPRVSHAVKHPGLIEVSHADVTDRGVPFLIMELLDGENLATLVENGLAALDAILAIGTQVAAAVAAMHRAGFIHCDVKPHNVFVLYDDMSTGWPRVKVIDYGVTRAIDESPMHDGMIMGTPAYMPPEQWEGAPTPKSDVYSLGCLLYELVTGEQPFSGTLPQLLILHSDQLPERPSTYRSSIPPALDAFVLRMLAKDPAMRPAMAEVETTLSQLAWKMTTAAPLPTIRREAV